MRLRTDATRRMKRWRDSALYLVFKVSLRLSERWRPLNGGRNLMGLLIDGARFEDGILAELRCLKRYVAREVYSIIRKPAQILEKAA